MSESESERHEHEYRQRSHPGDCLCSDCTADCIYEYWLDDD
ncbi:hypothetical protein ACFYZ8_44690 [Streptomyces sp. NPDC001668]